MRIVCRFSTAETDVIHRFLRGIDTLFKIVCISKRARAGFLRQPRVILLRAMNHSGMHSYSQKLFATSISIRERYRNDNTDISLPGYIMIRLEDQSSTIELDLSFTPVSRLIHMLEDAANMYSSIEAAEKSFVETQLQILMSRVQACTVNNRNPSTTALDHQQLSLTELHRIRRAIWRLRLFYEAFYEPYVSLAARERQQTEFRSSYASRIHPKPGRTYKIWGLSKAAKDAYISVYQRHFFHQLTDWELEEMECIWYHLRYQSDNIWRRPCPLCLMPLLPDHLVAHTRECRNQHLGNNDSTRWRSPCSPSFMNAAYRFRPDIEENSSAPQHIARGLLTWPDEAAAEPSEGYTFLTDHLEDIRPNAKPPTMARGARKDFVNWGYCIWDRERFEAYGLVDGPGECGAAKLDFWKMGGIRPTVLEADSFRAWSLDFARQNSSATRYID